MKQVSDNDEPKPEFTEEQLNRLVDYFDVLIQMDQNQKQKAKRDENK